MAKTTVETNAAKGKNKTGLDNPTPVPPPVPENALACSHPEFGTGRCASAVRHNNGATSWLVVWDNPTKVTHSWVPANQLEW